MNAKALILYLVRAGGLFALCRMLTRSAPRILCYHGGSLGDEHLFNSKLFSRPGLLGQRLHWLKRKGFVPSTLDALVEPDDGHAREGIPLIVTLDDGWHSSAIDLLPVLASHGYQPTLYLATKVFASGGPVVDVCLRYIVWKSPLMQASLCGFDAVLDGSYVLGQNADRERLCTAAERWMALCDDDVTSILARLELFAGALKVPAGALDLASRRFSYMSREELLDAVQQGCQIELHGHAHLYLTSQPERNRADIETCRQHIVTLGLPLPRHYCYPSGAYDAQAPAMLASVDVSTATTCMPGLIHGVSEDRRYFLPRFLDGADVSMIEFEAEMSGVLEFLRRFMRRSAPS